MQGTFEQATGTDWDQNSRTFNVWQESANVFRLRDNQHSTAASEIQVRNLAGQNIHTVCDNADSIVQRATINPWPSDTAGREEVSAVHNLGEVVSYFYTKYGTQGMRDNGAILTGCVHGTDSDFNASYSFSNYALKFRQATGSDAPSVAAIDGVGHEFGHGVYGYLVGNPVAGAQAVDAGLADFWGARIRNNARCARGGYINTTERCLRYLDVDSMFIVGYCAQDQSNHHCQGIRLASALLDATEASSGTFAGKVDSIVYATICCYLASLTDLTAAAYAMISFARQVGHQGTYPPYTSMYDASPTLELALLSNLLHGHPPVTVQMTPSYGFTLTINPTFYVYDITFEVGTQGQGFNYDGSIQWPDIEIPLAEDHYYESPIAYGQDELDWHSCSDGHVHGFRVTVNAGPNSYGPLTYYTAMSGCGGSLMAGPAPTDALPRKFAVRQAMQTSNGIVSASIVGSGGRPGSLGAQVRQYGLTALEIDIPINTVPAPIEMTVYNPQGRVVRRWVTTPIGPGTERVPWDRKNDRGEQAPPGVYVVLVNHGSYRDRTHFIIPAER